MKFGETGLIRQLRYNSKKEHEMQKPRSEEVVITDIWTTSVLVDSDQRVFVSPSGVSLV